MNNFAGSVRLGIYRMLPEKAFDVLAPLFRERPAVICDWKLHLRASTCIEYGRVVGVLG